MTPRERRQAWQDRQRYGRILVSVEIDRQQLAALEQLGLLPMGERDKSAIAAAVVRFLRCAKAIASVGDALAPDEVE
jgi:hypothetical protein